MKKKVLFICQHNSARSQMAEAFLNHLAGDRFEAESAGLEPGNLNPVAVEVMKEVGIDISNNKTKSVLEFHKKGKKYDYVITVCDEASAERCPVFPGIKLHWSFEDPSKFTGTYKERLEHIRIIRNKIKKKIEDFINEVVKGGDHDK